MNKTAIKSFAMWARVQLIQDVSTKARYFGISENGFINVNIVGDVITLDGSGAKLVILSPKEAAARKKLIDRINELAKSSNLKTAYQCVVEEIAYTWFNRIVAIRFMEVNGYLPSQVKVLSSDTIGKNEPDIVTKPQDAELNLSSKDNDYIYGLKIDNKQDELFKFLFIKQCNALGEYLPELFEAMDDYTEMMIDLKYTDSDGVVRKIVTDIDVQDFKDAVEIIGWMYQYYNTVPKQVVFDALKNNIKISKENIPAATQLFTPDWIVRYMIENSLGKKYIDSIKTIAGDVLYKDKEKKAFYYSNQEAQQRIDKLKSKWKYFIDSEEYELNDDFDITKITIIDPCMGSGHILVYAFEVLMDIYKDLGYGEKEIPELIIKYNLYGLDIDKRAYQLAYFAVMMMARKYDRRIFSKIGLVPHVYDIEESNSINRNQLKYFGEGMPQKLRKETELELNSLLDQLIDAKEYGSIINIDENLNWENLYLFVGNILISNQQSIDTIGIEQTMQKLKKLVQIGAALAQKYDVVSTNPPYMGSSGMNGKLSQYVKDYYPDSKSDLFAVFIEKCMDLTNPNGYTAMITQHAWMFLSSFEKLRVKIINSREITSMVHLGARAFDEIGGEVVQTVTFNLTTQNQQRKGSYFRLVDVVGEKEKANAFLSNKANGLYYKVYCKNFLFIPGSRIGYCGTDKQLSMFKKGNRLEDIMSIRQGLATGDNDKFLRLWHEVEFEQIGFFYDSIEHFHKSLKHYAPYNNGGGSRRWYGANTSIIKFDKNNYNLLALVGNHLPSKDFYFQKGITWSLISSGGKISARTAFLGSAFDVGGSCGFAGENNLIILGYLCTKVAANYLNIINPTQNKQVGDLKIMPFYLINENKMRITKCSDNAVFLAKKDWDSFESSWDFKNHPLF